MVADAHPSTLGLRRVKLLEGLDVDTLEDLARQARWRRCRSGQRVISRDSDDHDVYLIVAGKVRITAFSSAGRQVTFRDIAAGESFGELAAIDGQSRSADVDALEDSVLASIAPSAFKRLVHAHPVVCDRVLDGLAGVVRDLSGRVFEFSTLCVQNRVHAELLRLAKEAGVNGNAARLHPPPKHSDVASKVATNREQVTREFTALVKQGLLQRDGGALVIPDVAKLETLVAEVRRVT
jgi:CRP/FNR family transcriptional regulator, cyclic AMP receptor protein